MLGDIGKVRAKRSTSLKPYERKKSILRRVTDSVTGFLPQPSWLPSWLQRPPQQDDKIEEFEVEEMQRSSTSMVSESPETTSEGEQDQQRTSFIFRKSPELSYQDQSKTDPKSHRGRKTLSLHTLSQDSSLLSPSADGFNEESGGANSDGDHLSQSQSQSYCSASKKPRFNTIYFGPSAAEGRNINKSVVDSSFYAGRTTYGGASAYRRATSQPSASPFPYAGQRVYARPYFNSSTPSTSLNGSLPTASMTSNVVLSSTAQRFLRAMETKSTTAVTDVQRISISNTSMSSLIHADEPLVTGYVLNRRRPNLGPPVTKLSMQAQIVPRQQTKSAPSDAIASSTSIHSQGGDKLRAQTSPSARGLEPKVLYEEEEEDEMLAVVEPFESFPSFALLATPLSTSPLSIRSQMPEALTPHSTGQAIASTSTSPTITSRPFPPPMMTGSPSTPKNFSVSPSQSVTWDSTKVEERSTASDIEPVPSKSVLTDRGEINISSKPSRLDEDCKKNAPAQEQFDFDVQSRENEEADGKLTSIGMPGSTSSADVTEIPSTSSGPGFQFKNIPQPSGSSAPTTTLSANSSLGNSNFPALSSTIPTPTAATWFSSFSFGASSRLSLAPKTRAPAAAAASFAVAMRATAPIISAIERSPKPKWDEELVYFVSQSIVSPDPTDPLLKCRTHENQAHYAAH